MANSEDKAARSRSYVRKNYDANKAAGKTKLSFWMDPESAEALEAMMAQVPELTKAEIINRAIRFTYLKAVTGEDDLKSTAE